MSQITRLMSDYNTFSMNYRVLVVLIETGYFQQLLDPMGKNVYPTFLITVLDNADKNYVKEACCRMIIKFFCADKNKKGPSDDKAAEDLD